MRKKLLIWAMLAALLCPLAARGEEALPVLTLRAPTLNYVSLREGELALPAGESIPVTVKYRGTYSATFTGKRNYTLHLKDGAGNPRKVPLLGLRKDDDWVLLGGLSDGSRLRVPVGLALWRDLGYPAPAGAPCELYFNEYYKGLYFLVERPDRKSAGMPKNGALYRVMAAAAEGIDLLSMPAPEGPGDPEMWYNLGKVYPEGEGGWEPLSALLSAPDRAALLNLPAFADYYLYVNLLGASDNMTKNLYLCWDGARFSPMPWDLDAAFGRLYDATPSDPAAWYSNALYDDLVARADFQSLLRERWQAVRPVLSPDAVMARFTALYEELDAAGVWTREGERFPAYTDFTSRVTQPFDPAGELAFIRDFLIRRCALLDAALAKEN